MAGPVVRVMLASAGTVSLHAKIEPLIHLISPERVGNLVQVTTTLLIGGSYQADERPFLIDLDVEPPWDQLAGEGKTPELYEQVFGIRPDAVVTLSAMSNQDEDHRVLGELSIAVAERVSGIIDMTGLIVPRKTFLSTPDYRNASWLDVQQGVQAFTRAMPGKVAAIPYLTSSGREWASHAVDATFFRAWLAHPEFHMTK